MKEYPDGNLELLKMISSGEFNAQKAKEITAGIDFNQPIINPLDGYSTTYLFEAVCANNLAATAFLLENGADPNLNMPDLSGDCALEQLRYLDNGQDWETRYAISKLFFEHGANPNLKLERETLYDDILYEVYGQDPNDENDWENLLHLYKLIVIYGGGGKALGLERPQFLTGIDMSKVDEYEVRLHLCEDGYHIAGRLVDGDENEVAIL